MKIVRSHRFTAIKKVNIKSILYSEKIAPYVFALPFVISFLLFFFYSGINTIIMSFQEILGPSDIKFIGLRNYVKLWNNHFLNALINNTRYTFWTLLILIPIPIILAVFLNSKTMIGRNFFRSALFLPALTSVIVAGIVFRLLFGDMETAFMNTVLKSLGIAPLKWQAGKHTAMFIMVALACWRWTGVNIIYFLSGLQTIPLELYESADIDGANSFSKFKNITLPLLKPVIIYVLTISIYGGYAMFAESFVYWSNNSPGDIGLTIVGYLYAMSFEQNDMGFGSAIGIVLLMIVLTINAIQLKFFGLFNRED